MANSYFQFKQFTVHQDRCAMKVTTDSCLFGSWLADKIEKENSTINNCLDIGTGTGLLSLMLSQKSNSLIDAIEIDPAAVEQAIENISASQFSEKVSVIHADVKSFEFKKKYDAIISNPPFYEKELKGDVNQKNMAHHDDGLLLKELLSIIKTNLKPDGTFYLLLPFKRNDEIRELLTDKQLSILQITFVRQTVSHDYFRIMLSGKHNAENNNETAINEITIKDEKGNYSTEFTELLKDYYLHL